MRSEPRRPKRLAEVVSASDTPPDPADDRIVSLELGQVYEVGGTEAERFVRAVHARRCEWPLKWERDPTTRLPLLNCEDCGLMLRRIA